jgi:hypothetical protein
VTAMKKKLFLLLVLGLIGFAAYHQRQDIERYVRIKQM